MYRLQKAQAFKMLCAPFLFLIVLLFLSARTAVSAPQCCVSPTGHLPLRTPVLSMTRLSPWANPLGWITTPHSLQNCCGGYFYEPASVSAHPSPAPIPSMPMKITVAGNVYYAAASHVILEKKVTLTQPGRVIKADRAILRLDKNAKNVKNISLFGHVSYQEAGKRVVGHTAYLDLVHKMLTINTSAYHLKRHSPTGPLDAWGSALCATHYAPRFFCFHNVTYSTCPPEKKPAWHLKAQKMMVDKKLGYTTANGVVLYAKNFPILYLPYLRFPTDKKRHSGFLSPKISHENRSGMIFQIPYYINLAPNYDDKITVTPITKRGVMFGNIFRYLTPHNAGSLQFNILPNDSAFRTFKETQPLIYPSNPFNDPFLRRIAQSSNTRFGVFFKNDTQLQCGWGGLLTLQHVSDDYYFQDFASGLTGINTDQLLNEGELHYVDTHWHFVMMFQKWQTLHAINQNPIADQYRRMPTIELATFWPKGPLGLDYSVSSEWTRFTHVNDFFTGVAYPAGNRVHLAPKIALNIVRDAGFFVPSITLDTTLYDVNHNAVIKTDPPPTDLMPSDAVLHKVRVLPEIQLDTGLYAQRCLTLCGHPYIQTIEPRAFYAFIPFTDQSDIPLFDTDLPSFSMERLFAPNRFIGLDRIGDTNSLALGLSTRTLSAETGEEKIKATIGGKYFFSKRRVCLCPDCSDSPNLDARFSPLVGELIYHLNPRFSVVGNAAWDTNAGHIDNDTFAIQYTPKPKHIVNLAYNFVQDGDILSNAPEGSSENNLHRIHLSMYWPLPHTDHWHTLGSWYYNISHKHGESYLGGVEYNGCCWAMRLVGSRTLRTEDGTGNLSFHNAWYIQFLLKGLGASGGSHAAQLLTESIPGYTDLFKH